MLSWLNMVKIFEEADDQPYPPSLVNPFSRLLRHAGSTVADPVGLYSNAAATQPAVNTNINTGTTLYFLRCWSARHFCMFSSAFMSTSTVCSNCCLY